jgi:signal transduction histidine kinase
MVNTPLRVILFRYALLVGGVPLLLTTILAVLWLIPRAKSDLNRYQQQLAAAVATQVESYLTTSHAIVQTGAGLHVNDLADHNLMHVQHVLETNVRTLKHLHALYLVDSKGRIITAAISGGTEKQHKEMLGLDLSHNPLIARVLKEKKEQWSDTFLSVVGGGLSVALAVPSGNRVMVGEFELASLTRFLKQIATNKQMDIFVLDHRGQVIADQNGSYTAQQLNLSNIPLVQKGLLSAAPQTGSYSFDGKMMVGSLYRVSGVNWSVLIAQPKMQAYNQLFATGGITAAGILTALITGMGIALTLARSLADRFERLTVHAQLTAAGAQTSDWPSSHIAEFNTLATNLQQMSESLHERARLLEDEIGERQKAQEALHEKALLLEQEIAERVLAEQELQVKQNQLETLNMCLEQRVQEELVKNREKDLVMIQQGRLAAMGEMISNIAHQWRQPLNELGIMIQMLRVDYDDKLLDGHRIDMFINECMTTIQHMSQTINTFRDFFKKNRSSQKFDVSGAITATINLLRVSFQAAGIRLHLELQQGCALAGQENDLSQVILNLCNNARDILLERAVVDPSITVTCQTADDNVVIVVEDNAGGISDTIIEKIFDPYFTTRHKSQGTGLGLYICKNIVEGRFQGRIEASDTEAGARFRVVIPCPSAE